MPAASKVADVAIEVSHLTKVFGGRTAVSDVSFSVASGEVFGFLGPNGAGKTTTVRILATLISPTAGSAMVAGIPVGLAAALAGGLLAVDCAACLVVVRLFDRERLITGARPSRGIPAPAAPQDIRSPGEVTAHRKGELKCRRL